MRSRTGLAVQLPGLPLRGLGGRLLQGGRGGGGESLCEQLPPLPLPCLPHPRQRRDLDGLPTAPSPTAATTAAAHSPNPSLPAPARLAASTPPTASAAPPAFAAPGFGLGLALVTLGRQLRR